MPIAPTIKAVWLSMSIASELKRLAAGHFPYEVGGILAGYLNNDAAVITAVVGPGPLAEHCHESFLPDHTYQTEQMHRIFQASKGQTVYLGDWHTHPLGPPILSPLDIKTMQTIAESPEADCPNPLMILLSNPKAEWDIRSFCLANIGGRSPKVREMLVHLFQGGGAD